MKLEIKKCSENPVVRPGKYPWRMVATMNPAVIYENSRFTMFERAAGGLHPFQCFLGMLESEDGIHWEHKIDKPVVTGEMVGFKYGSVQDPRIVKIDDDYLMTFAFRPFSYAIVVNTALITRRSESERIRFTSFADSSRSIILVTPALERKIRSDKETSFSSPPATPSCLSRSCSASEIPSSSFRC